MILSSFVLVLCVFFFGYGVSEHELFFNGKFSPTFNGQIEEGPQRKPPTKCLKGKSGCLGGQKSTDDTNYRLHLGNTPDLLRPVFDKRGVVDRPTNLFTSLVQGLLAGKPCCRNKNKTRIRYYRNDNETSTTMSIRTNTRRRQNKRTQSEHNSRVCNNCKSLNTHSDSFLNRMMRTCALIHLENPTHKIKCIVMRRKNTNAESYKRSKRIRANPSSNYIANKLNDHAQKLKKLYENLFGEKKSKKEDDIKFGRYEMPSKVIYADERVTSDVKRPGYHSNSHVTVQYPHEKGTSEENPSDFISNSQGSFKYTNEKKTSEDKSFGLNSISHGSDKYPDDEEASAENHSDLSSNGHGTVTNPDEEETSEIKHPGFSSNSQSNFKNPNEKGTPKGKYLGLSSFWFNDGKQTSENKRPGFSTNSHDSFKYPDGKKTSEGKRFGLSSNSDSSVKYPDEEGASEGKHNGLSSNSLDSVTNPDGKGISKGKGSGFSFYNHSSFNYPDKEGTLDGKPSRLSSNSHDSVSHPNGKRTSKGKHPGLSSNTHGIGKYSHDEERLEEKLTNLFQGVEWTLNKTHSASVKSPDREEMYEEKRLGLASNSLVEKTLNKTYDSNFSRSNTNTVIHASSPESAGNGNTIVKMNSLASLFNKSDISQLNLSEINELIIYLIKMKNQLSVNVRNSNATVGQEEKKQLIQTNISVEENYSSSNEIYCDVNCNKVDNLIQKVLRFRKHLSSTYNVR